MRHINPVPQLKVRATTTRNIEAGQALIVVVLALVVLLAMMGLGIDMGYLRYQKGRIAAAADAAAIAGGAEILFADITTAALGAAKANGFADSSQGGTATVTVNHPPSSGPHAGDDSFVEVFVSQPQPTFFMTVLGIDTMPLTARAVAKGTSPNCLYALGPTSPAMTLTLAFITSQCGVIDNSNMQGTIANLRAPFIGVHGTVSGVSTTPAATLGIPVAADPFGSLAVPPNTDPTCSLHPTKTTITAATTLDPGTYCGGIAINFPAGGGTVTLNPGVYYINGGGFQMLGTFGARVTGNGVTIYNSGSGSGSCNTCFGSIITAFTSGSGLTAPTTGTYSGILYFQDRANINSATFAVNISNGGGFQQGAYYIPNAAVNFGFDFGSTAAYSILVAKTITWTVAFTFGNDYSSLPKGSPIKNTGVLVE